MQVQQNIKKNVHVLVLYFSVCGGRGEARACMCIVGLCTECVYLSKFSLQYIVHVVYSVCI